MKRLLLILTVALLPSEGWATDRAAIIRMIVDEDILPGFERLALDTGKLASAANTSCEPRDLKAAYSGAFETWTRLSHLRFGPSEENNRAFALAFWPDPRGNTAKTLRKLILAADPDVLLPAKFREASVAVRGFHALDYLLFDNGIRTTGDPEFRCALIRTVARDINTTAHEMQKGWMDFAPSLTGPGPQGPYRDTDEVLRALFNAASTGLQFTAELRLGRPLGTFDRPRPNRAEAWRSGLSLNLIDEAVSGSGGLALRLATDEKALAARLSDALADFKDRLSALDDRSLSGVAIPEERVRVEALLADLNDIRRLVGEELGPNLGVAAGFNALDGD